MNVMMKLNIRRLHLCILASKICSRKSQRPKKRARAPTAAIEQQVIYYPHAHTAFIYEDSM